MLRRAQNHANATSSTASAVTSWHPITSKGLSMSPKFARAATALAASCSLAGCAWLHDTFSSSVDEKTSGKVHAAVPIGTPMDTAEARLSAQGFDCGTRTGNFTDERGR